MSSLSKQIFTNLTTAILVVVVLFGVACSKEPPEKIGAVKDRKKMPMLSAKKLTTVISDSGITRYRIITDKFSIDVQETTNSVVIFKSYGDYDRVMEYEATPQSVFDMFTQHSDGVVHYANGMDINIKIEK